MGCEILTGREDGACLSATKATVEREKWWDYISL